MTETVSVSSSAPRSSDATRVAVVVPAYNESENMPELFAELGETIRRSRLNAEILLVDDGSSDGTLRAAREAAAEAELDRVSFLSHRGNRGKTAAVLTAVRESRADYIVLFDADLQHSTDEIPRFVEKLDEGWDLVAGRKTGRYEKRVVSGFYNWLSRVVFRVPVHDLNAMKAFRRIVLDEVHLRRDWHRFLVVLAFARGFRVTEIDIALHPRRHGRSKYSDRGRIMVGTLDLLSVWFQLVFSRKPMLFFGFSGLSLMALGGLTGIVALYLRFVAGAGFRPLLTLVVFLVLVGMLLFVVGLLAELIAGLRSEIEELRRDLKA